LFRIITRLPFCTWFAVALCLQSVLSVWKPADDGGGFGAFLVLTRGLWSFPIYLPHEMLFSNGQGIPMPIPMPMPIAIAIGNVACVVCDLLLRLIINGTRGKKSRAEKT
jgi:peptidoglycan/LPS O-acetylase OafA/YrhL